MPSDHRLRPRLTFSNAISTLALFVALGGSAYAAGVLPANSVGRAQLRGDAVTASKIARNSVGRSELRPESVGSSELARGSVNLRSLEPALRERLSQAGISGRPGATGAVGSTGAQGPAGGTGPTGAQGPAGPGAVPIHYLQHASTSPSRAVVTDVAGLRMEAECEDTSPGTQLNLAVISAEAATGVETISVDSGPGEPESAESHTGNLQIDLPAGETVLGGPSTGAGEYGRIVANLIFTTAAHVVDLNIALVLNGTAGTCAIDGIGVPASD